MPRPSDKTTPLSLSAPALKALYPDSLSGDEALNALGSFTLAGFSDSALTLDKAVASHLTLSLRRDDKTRPVDGLCAAIRQLPGDATADRYSVTLRPWLWWLSLAGNNRIFQNQSVPDIVKAVFAGHGFSDYQLKLDATYPKREYCVQFGESDLNFVMRLLEDAGIFWFFTHADGKHTLVLADGNSHFPDCPNNAKIPYLGQDLGGRELEGVRSAGISRQAVAGGYRAGDYEFTTASASLYAQALAKSDLPNLYQYPGGYAKKADGDALAKQRSDGLRAEEVELVGDSDCRWLIPGHCFTLSGHPDPACNIAWVITRVSHEAGQQHYRNRFAAIPKATPYRPPRLTPKPVMHPQVAKVVGKAGEEIWTDKYGRVKVQFPWDRDGKDDESSSCWLRVMQPWSGKGFGMQFIPRIGQEVIVSFIDGDPDKPLVSGCVYNGDNALPYELPAKQTQSGLKTNSTKGGGGFNELRFDDSKDKEEVFFQAQKNYTVKVLNDVAADVGHDETLVVKNERKRSVTEGNDSLSVDKGNRTVEVKTGNETLNVKGKRTVKVEGDQSHSTGGNHEHKVSGNYTLTVDGNLTIKVSGTLTLQSGGAFTAKSDAAYTAQAGTSLTNKAGTGLTNQAGTELTNKAGTTLTNDAGVSLTNKASASQTVDGGGMLTLKGGLIQQN